jgi:hypothetical protein
MQSPEIEVALMKILAAGPWKNPDTPKGKRVGLKKLAEVLGKLGTPCQWKDLIDPIQTSKGRGYMNTDPKIIDAAEWEAIEFMIWLTPMGKAELQKRLDSGSGSAGTGSASGSVSGQ